jgi:hypothetical protein
VRFDRDERELRDLVIVGAERIDPPAVGHNDAAALAIVADVVGALGITKNVDGIIVPPQQPIGPEITPRSRLWLAMFSGKPTFNRRQKRFRERMSGAFLSPATPIRRACCAGKKPQAAKPPPIAAARTLACDDLRIWRSFQTISAPPRTFGKLDPWRRYGADT